MNIKGICTSLPAVFDQNRQLDIKQYVDACKLIIQTGTNTLLLFAQPVDTAQLDQEEEKLILDATLKLCRESHAPVIVANQRTSAETAAKWARRIQQAGADAMLIIPPAHLAHRTPDLIRFMDELSSTVSLPILIQDMARGASCPLPPATLAELTGRHSNLMGFVIEAVPSGPAIDQLLQTIPHDRQVLLGNQPLHLTEAFHRGCAGAVAGPATQIVTRKIWDALEQGDYGGAQAYSDRLARLLTLVSQSDIMADNYEKDILQRLGILPEFTSRTPGFIPDPVMEMLFQQAYSQLEEDFLP